MTPMNKIRSNRKREESKLKLPSPVPKKILKKGQSPKNYNSKRFFQNTNKPETYSILLQNNIS